MGLPLLAVVGVIGAGVSLVVAPFALGAVGFTKAGIAAGSYAATMMSTAAVGNGGGVAATSMVAALQSVGAAGMGTALASAVAGAGATVATAATALIKMVIR